MQRLSLRHGQTAPAVDDDGNGLHGELHKCLDDDTRTEIVEDRPRRAPTGCDSSRDLSIDIENEWRRRLYFGALITDATQSMYLGRPITLRFDEGRVPQLFLDTYEELEEWKPLIDETQPADDNTLLIKYRPKPAVAISTFTHLIRLAQISSKITQSFYSLASAKWTHDGLVRCKDSLEDDLSRWHNELPVHLRFEPDVHATPPPHQITPQLHVF